MRFRRSLFALLAVCLVGAPVSAQNREHQQIFADLRMLQEQVQRLQLSLNTVVEQLKTTNTRLETQDANTRKGFADQNVAINAISGTVRSLVEKENENSVSVARLTSEMKQIRDGLTIQQTMLSQIMSLLQTPPDPNAPPPPTGGGTPAPRPPDQGMPPSPQSYFDAAWGFYASSKFDDAILLFQDFLKRFPDHPDAPRAQMMIGDSQLMLGKYKEALNAFSEVIARYKASDQLPDAYYKQGFCQEQLGQKAAAEKSYKTVIAEYPQSTAATLAAQALKKIKG